ncbi:MULTISPECIES: FxsA family protein [Bacillaceae]|uniref:FxsA family protein n=1 Tax=Bacillaceae TaxID=186817 RepID=UPI000C75D669|nr:MULTISPECIES: FxsA family protein [Bacillaceae]PLR68389.1 membrane protein FxsA [Bacillus sp. UMB0893]QNG60965.1 membrane protein FxsA [Bacillus sp. PAMC26568]
MRYLLPFLIIIPACEIGILLFSGKTIGIIPTILLIIATGIAGAWLAKKQGLEAIRKVQQEMSFGKIPGESILDGLCILVGGLLLLTPGFVTDLTGFILLIPATRKFVKPLLQKAISKSIDQNRFKIIR